MSKDSLFSQKIDNIPDFKFDESVAPIFTDMIKRSVPGYATILNLLGTITEKFTLPEHNYYDLGCSLGASMLAMGQRLNNKNCFVVGVDNSIAMLNKAKPIIDAAQNQHKHAPQYQLVCADINNIEIQKAAMVVMNFTLQFVPLEQRDHLIQKIYHGLSKGGACIISEKIKFEEPKEHDLMIEIHHRFKSDQGYSKLEISQKREAIEHVLVPETLLTHTHRLEQAGFSIIMPWFQNLQFISLLAIK